VALNDLELASQLTKDVITPEIVTTAAQKRLPLYDKAAMSTTTSLVLLLRVYVVRTLTRLCII